MGSEFNFVDTWNACSSLDEVCDKTGKSRRRAVSLASAHRASGKSIKYFPRPAPFTALIGEEFVRWTVIGIAVGRKRICVCRCGRMAELDSSSLTGGHSKGCGKLGCKTPSRLGVGDPRRQFPEYKTWIGMRLRCTYKSVRGYHNYGGRGIEVCDRWEKSYFDFLADMGRKPTPEHTLDRIDVDGNYEPNNCRWATAETQRLNTRKNRDRNKQAAT